ncbi:hypothetical protein LPJ66_011679, partial [Kickxella alabastrina]
MREMRPALGITVAKGEFPSTGFSRARKVSKNHGVAETKTVPASSAAATIAATTIAADDVALPEADKEAEAGKEADVVIKTETETISEEWKAESAPPVTATTTTTTTTTDIASDAPATAQPALEEKAALPSLDRLLSEESVGRRMWQHLQVSDDMADVRDMIADSPTGVVVLPQSAVSKSTSLDLGTLLNDNVLFTDQTFPTTVAAGANNTAQIKFTTVSGICGTVDRGS